MNNKIKSYSALAMASAITVPLACKKESNDPNIIDKVINKKIIAVETSGSSFLGIDSIDLDNNGIFDIAFAVIVGKNDSTAATYSVGINDNALFLNESGGYFSNLPLNTGTTLDTFNFSANQFEDISIFHQKDVSISLNKGIGGKGDKYTGIVLRSSGSNFHAGWMKVNLSADLRTFTIKEYAYQKEPVVSIKIGQK